jgi:hypothetical protein
MKKVSEEILKKILRIKNWDELASQEKMKQYLSLYPFVEEETNQKILQRITSLCAVIMQIIVSIDVAGKVSSQFRKDVEIRKEEMIELLSKQSMSEEELKFTLEKITTLFKDINKEEEQKRIKRKQLLKSLAFIGGITGFAVYKVTEYIKKILLNRGRKSNVCLQDL